MENQEFNNTNQYGGGFANPPQPQPQAVPMKPKNWMTEAILVTVIPLCCLCNIFSLLGIVAIVYASKVNNLYFAGLYREAEQAAKDAKMWVVVTFWIAIGYTVLYTLSWVLFSSFWMDFINNLIDYSAW